ncbi:hypothetical protein ACHAWF_000053 [Thalassiosira exigua]
MMIVDLRLKLKSIGVPMVGPGNVFATTNVWSRTQVSLSPRYPRNITPPTTTMYGRLLLHGS